MKRVYLSTVFYYVAIGNDMALIVDEEPCAC